MQHSDIDEIACGMDAFPAYIYGPYSKASVIRKSKIIETIGDPNVGKRTVELTYTPKAKTDINQDGQVTAADDDFGFNEGMNFL